jgi:hypothetical protein
LPCSRGASSNRISSSSKPIPTASDGGVSDTVFDTVFDTSIDTPHSILHSIPYPIHPSYTEHPAFDVAIPPGPKRLLVRIPEIIINVGVVECKYHDIDGIESDTISGTVPYSVPAAESDSVLCSNCDILAYMPPETLEAW